MTTYSLARNEWGIHGITLVANQIDTIQFGDDVDEIEILSHDGAAAVYFTVDGNPPAVEGRGSRVLPAAINSVMVEPPTAGPTIVKVVSAGTPKISVMRTS